MTLTDTLLINHTAVTGGAIYANGSAVVELDGSTVSTNSAIDGNRRGTSIGAGGGLYLADDSSLTLTGASLISHNVAFGNGGGLYVAAPHSRRRCRLVFTRAQCARTLRAGSWTTPRRLSLRWPQSLPSTPPIVVVQCTWAMEGMRGCRGGDAGGVLQVHPLGDSGAVYSNSVL